MQDRREDGDSGSGDNTATTAKPTIVARGLNGPVGVLVETDGTLWISESGTGGDQVMQGGAPDSEPVRSIPWGLTARLIRVGTDGTQTHVLSLPSMITPEGPDGAGRIVVLDGTLYVTSGAWTDGMSIDRPSNMAAIVRVMHGNASELVTTWDIERRDNPDGAAIETNPFDLTVGPDRALWLTDAAGNTLYRIDPATRALELRAVFSAMTGPIPRGSREPDMTIQAVPTAVAFDADGDMYVSLMPGVPYLPGSGRVVRVSQDGRVSDYATGLTSLTDLVTGPDGQLYAVSVGLFTEHGPVANTGAIVRIREGPVSDTILSGLSFPSTLAFANNGDAYVARNSIGPAGSGEVVRYAALVSVR